MKVAHLSEQAEERVVFRDGLGVREARDSGTGEVVEWFHLDPAFAAVDTPLRDRVGRLAKLQHVKFARILGLEAAGRDRGPILVSSHVPGIRLAEALEMAGHGLITFEPGAGLQILREVLGALAVLHDSRNVAHGALGPERVVIAPTGRAVVVEHVLAQALERLQRPRHQLWREWRVPTPPAAGPVRFDMHTDLAQAGILALAVLLGRPLDEDEYPHRLRGLLPLVHDRLGRSPSAPVAGDVVAFLERLAPVDSRRAFKTVREAQQAYEGLVAGSATSMGVTLARVKAVFAAAAALNVAGSPPPTADPDAVAIADPAAAMALSVVAPALLDTPSPLPAVMTAANVNAADNAADDAVADDDSDSDANADADIDIAALLALEAELEGGTAPARVPGDLTQAPQPADGAPVGSDAAEDTTEPEPCEAGDLAALAQQRLDLERQFADLVAAVAPAADAVVPPPSASPWTSEPLVAARVLWSSMPVAEHGGDDASAPATVEPLHLTWAAGSHAALPADPDSDLDLPVPFANVHVFAYGEDAPPPAEPDAETDSAADAVATPPAAEAADGTAFAAVPAVDAEPEVDAAGEPESLTAEADALEPWHPDAAPDGARAEWWKEALPWREAEPANPGDDVLPETVVAAPEMVSADVHVDEAAADDRPWSSSDQLADESPSMTEVPHADPHAGGPLVQVPVAGVAEEMPASAEVLAVPEDEAIDLVDAQDAPASLEHGAPEPAAMIAAEPEAPSIDDTDGEALALSETPDVADAGDDSYGASLCPLEEDSTPLPLPDPIPEVVVVDDEHDRNAWDYLPSEVAEEALPLATTPIIDVAVEMAPLSTRKKRRRTRRKKGPVVEPGAVPEVARPQVVSPTPSAVMATMALSLTPMRHEPAGAPTEVETSRGVRPLSLLDRSVPAWTPLAEPFVTRPVSGRPSAAEAASAAPVIPATVAGLMTMTDAPVATLARDAVPASSGMPQMAGPQGALGAIAGDVSRPFEQEIRAVGMPDVEEWPSPPSRAAITSVGDAMGSSAPNQVRFSALDSWSAASESPVARRGANWRRLAAASVLVALFQGAAFAAWWWVQPGAHGTLVVQTDKSGVEVLLDDKVVGRTPFREEVAPGRHKLKLREGGYMREMPVEISVGVVTTQAIDWPSAGAGKGSLQVTSNPAGAEIFVNGRSRGKAPQLLERLPAGDQVLMLRGDAGSVTVTATVLAGETTPLEVKIFAGWIQVDAAVELNLLLNGREKIGSSMDGQILLPPGVHRVQAVNDSLGIRQWLTMTVEPGAVKRVPFVVQPGTLTLRDEAEVFIDGAAAGTTPGTISIAPGTHEIAIRHPDGSERRQAMTVRAGQRVEF